MAKRKTSKNSLPEKVNLPTWILETEAGGSVPTYHEQGLKEIRDKVAIWVQRKLVEIDPDKVADGVITVLNSYALHPQ
jgi:hypothetical protein